MTTAKSCVGRSQNIYFIGNRIMDKKRIIDKIIDDLPTRDMRVEMTNDEWHGWLEEAFDKGYAEALRTHDVVGRRERFYCASNKDDRYERCEEQCHLCKMDY